MSRHPLHRSLAAALTARLPVRLPMPLLMPLLASLLVLATGCASLHTVLPAAGQDEAAAVAALGPPSARYAMPDGGTRLEFARGPMGRETYMVDLDAGGRVSQAEQVLDLPHLRRVADGMSRAALLRLLGRPGERQREYQDRETWYWRYANNDCLVFAVTLSAQGRVIGGGSQMPDPRCELPTPR
ncbi:hypothetical protein [Aquabacterium sp. OR-4]|uniref:hypothetical protein n=1 Tax=Aquabacterium sp. OR-4 TaxID=2978127 RepID=UPI0028C6350E|nr:hypothetical protein [Aquabacterium sp. OR-4]MDT7836236.1 hypothetical protein [Aquabacterium sp. OR-4]